MAKGRHLLLQIHQEYTSITDELESVCHMIASPTSSRGGTDDRPKNVNELSNPEFAALIEKQHLKECEDSDYLMMERILQTRGSVDDSDDMFDDFHEDGGGRKMLRRETAIELPVTPSKSNILSLAESVGGNEEHYSIRNERQTSASNRNSMRDSKNSPVSLSSQNSPRNSQFLQSSYLNPSSFDGGRIYKKSCESLQKNSSTDTEYSLQPYRFIKQSSNETNSSINVDNSSITNDLSMDGETSLNSTVIEMLAGSANLGPPEDRTGFTKRTASLGSSSLVHQNSDTTNSTSTTRQSFLKKQLSIDKTGAGAAAGSIPENLERLAPPSSKPKPTNRFFDNLSVLGTKSVMSLLKESSSTSTDDTHTASLREPAPGPIPCISTNLVQDEIAKLSSNIKSSTDEDTDPPFNETMC